MEVSLLVPTYNEAANIGALATAARAALAGVEAEMLVLDDGSPDGTADAADRAVPGFCRAVRRTGPRGLSHAVIEGFSLAAGEYVVVMDADLSHPPELLPRLLAPLRAGEADLAVASRYVPGGSTPGWPLRRRVTSRVACWLARPFTPVKDATSGYFACRRDVVQGVDFDPRGFKIGLEVFVKGRWKRVVEVPYAFQDRRAGESKLGARVMFHYLEQLAALVPRRRTTR